jgi:hypothetical protein
MKHLSLVIGINLLSAGSLLALSGSLQFGYETKHVYRGVDSALDKEIVWSLAQVNQGHGYMGVWYGTGSTSDYEEVDLYGGYTFHVNEWRVTPNFIWYYFPENSSAASTDLMLKVDRIFGGEGATTLTPELIYSYNIDAKGHYLEAGLVISYAATESWALSLRPALALSNDLRPENGLDHAEVIGRATYKVNENLSVQGFIGYSYSLKAIDSFQDNITWGGLTLIARF